MSALLNRRLRALETAANTAARTAGVQYDLTGLTLDELLELEVIAQRLEDGGEPMTPAEIARYDELAPRIIIRPRPLSPTVIDQGHLAALKTQGCGSFANERAN